MEAGKSVLKKLRRMEDYERRDRLHKHASRKMKKALSPGVADLASGPGWRLDGNIVMIPYYNCDFETF